MKLIKTFFSTLTHVNPSGKATMVDISQKMANKRTAIASGKIKVGTEIYQAIYDNQIKKGDVLTVSKIAGIIGAKRTHDIIPLCHPININFIDIKLELQYPDTVFCKAIASACDSTGVEMEALTAVSIASLTVYDMCKAMSKDIVIENIQLDSKTGGKSGDFYRNKE